MLRKAVQGAVVAGAATLLAVGAASPAMAESNYDLSQNDFGIDILSNLCVNVADVVDLVDVDVLTALGGASCDMNDTDINTMVDDTDADIDGGHHWDHKKHHGWDD
ncbi:hypothetical protein LO763_23965 [Glycomyces sp. A-F 0318]|uniref:hypothetical protein n=1 Tax=Glycomyces amatae TaxID=2881355 RepID=UPI001E33DEDE|nr:hypothetical protein [Glycomyces amatae]MCD0446678.1 hypothetical protein [Glycomyces amatae]